MMIRIRKAEEIDIPEIHAIMQQARRYFAAENIPQWQGEYPAEIDIVDDLKQNGGYAAEEDGIVVGYCFIQVMKDPNYDHIEGKWLNEEPYAVMHRTCIHNEYKGKGIAGMFLEKALQMAENVRADTHEKNLSMRKMLENHGFQACGTIYVEDGTPRIGYQYTKERRPQ
ncbi:MAG: GNAT family N-acetyltransferase [Erysipelotrichaceae bacterium]|jgi:predicted GNAT family N-acyltransferase|nr:GNAT family N-acetyltransferase [Erysipelotrichaceae bacterium]